MANISAAASPVPPDDEAFQKAMNILATRPRRERNAVIAFILWWFGMARETRAAIACVIRPDMKREDVAILVGVSPRRLGDWEAYQRSKPNRLDYKHIRRHTSKRRKSSGGRWPTMDNPDKPSG